MKHAALVLAVLVAPACVVHIHVHEAPRQTAAVAEHAPHSGHPTPHDGSEHVRGVVVDAQGRRVKARVAVVGKSGSYSSWSNDSGEFEVPSGSWPEAVIHANTEDGQVAVQRVKRGESDLRLQLRPGSTLSIDLAAPQAVRCAVFAGELRIEDFTLRPGETAQVVVPSGAVRVQPYEGDRIHEERTLELATGDARSLRFDLATKS